MYHSNQNVCRPTKYVGDFGGCWLFVPLPTSNSWTGNFAKLTDKGLCVPTESSDLLAKPPIRMTDFKILEIFWDAGNFWPLPTSNSGEFVR